MEKKFHTEKLIINFQNIEKDLNVNENRYLNAKDNGNKCAEDNNNYYINNEEAYKKDSYQAQIIKRESYQDNNIPEKNWNVNNVNNNANKEYQPRQEDINGSSFNPQKLQRDVEKSIQEKSDEYNLEEVKKKRTRKFILICVILLILAVIIFLIVWFTVSNKEKDKTPGDPPISNPIDNNIVKARTSDQFQVLNKNAFENMASIFMQCDNDYVLNFINLTKNANNNVYSYSYKCIKMFESSVLGIYDKETVFAGILNEESGLTALNQLQVKCDNNDALTYVRLYYSYDKKISYKYKCAKITNPRTKYACTKYTTKEKQGLENIDLLIGLEIGRSNNAYLNGFQLSSNKIINTPNVSFSYDVSDCIEN